MVIEEQLAGPSTTGSRLRGEAPARQVSAASAREIKDEEAVEAKRLGNLVADQLRAPFRGSITDYARTIELGSGYIGSWADDNLCRNCRAKGGIIRCRHFEIDTARHLAGPFAAILDPNVRLVMLLKAAQTAGSLVWDMTLHFLIVHSSYMRIKILLDSDEKALKYCDHRLMETLKKNPDIMALMEGVDRFDITKTEIKFKNGKTVIIGGLNDSNASSLPSDVIVVDEGWLHQSDGLMRKAIDRTKQIKHRKVIIVGQAGNKDEDQDRLWKSLHKRVPLTFACPCCNGRQEFNLTKERPSEFVPVIPNRERTASGALVISYAGLLEMQWPLLPPEKDSYWGMKVDKRFKEIESEEAVKAVAATAYLECYHCGFKILDTRALRQALNDSYEQEYRVLGPGGVYYTPENYEVGFWNPDPASMNVPFKDTMQEYIVAKKSHEELGNIIPLQDFYKNRWATAWDAQLSSKSMERPAAAIYEIDAKNKYPGEKCRISSTDIQFKLTHMVYMAVAVGDGTPPRMLHWEWVRPPSAEDKTPPLIPYGQRVLDLIHAGLETDYKMAEFCKARVRELDAHFGIQPQNSMKDGGHELGLVKEWAAEDAIWGRMRDEHGRLKWQWVAYGILIGDDRTSYKWPHPGRRDTWERFKQHMFTKVPAIKSGKRVMVDVHHRLWSNPSIKEIAERWRDGAGAPKLQIHPMFMTDSGPDGLWKQLTSEVKTDWKGHPGKKHYNNEGRPNHGWDDWCMIVVRMDELGYLNSFGPPKADTDD